VGQHGLQGIDGDQGPGKLPLMVDGHKQLDLGPQGCCLVRIGIGSLAQLVGKIKGIPGDGGAEDIHLLMVRHLVGVGIHHLAGGVQPDQLLHLRIVLDDVLGPHLEDMGRAALPLLASLGGGRTHIQAGLVDQLLITGKMEAETLFNPENVSDQGIPLFLHVVAMQQPEQADQRHH